MLGGLGGHQRASSLPFQNHYIRTYFTYSSRNPVFVAVANKARAVGKDYVEAVKGSAGVAGLGVVIAADVINLCDYLSKGIDAGIPSFIDGTKKIVHQALGEAGTTNMKFRGIRERLCQVCCGL